MKLCIVPHTGHSYPRSLKTRSNKIKWSLSFGWLRIDRKYTSQGGNSIKQDLLTHQTLNHIWWRIYGKDLPGLEDEVTLETGDKYIQTTILLLHSNTFAQGTVSCCLHNADRNIIGHVHDNPILDTYLYNVGLQNHCQCHVWTVQNGNQLIFGEYIQPRSTTNYHQQQYLPT